MSCLNDILLHGKSLPCPVTTIPGRHYNVISEYQQIIAFTKCRSVDLNTLITPRHKAHMAEQPPSANSTAIKITPSRTKEPRTVKSAPTEQSVSHIRRPGPRFQTGTSSTWASVCLRAWERKKSHRISTSNDEE